VRRDGREVAATPESRDCEIAKTKNENNTMKKFVIIAFAALLTSAGVVYAAHNHNQRMLEDHTKCEGIRCSFCKGTGFNGNFLCFFCKGSGSNNSY